MKQGDIIKFIDGDYRVYQKDGVTIVRIVKEKKKKERRYRLWCKKQDNIVPLLQRDNRPRTFLKLENFFDSNLKPNIIITASPKGRYQTCQYCHKSFLVLDKRQRFCSKKCQQSNYYVKKIQRPSHHNSCTKCGNLFESKRPAKFCCVQCRVANYRKGKLK